MVVNLDEAKIDGLKDVFRGYKKGDVSGDDLVLEVSQSLNVENSVGLRILEKIFP